MSHPIEVQVLGQSFSVTSEDDEQHVRQAAKMVDEQIRKITGGTRAVPPFSAAVITALNLASEYQKLKIQYEYVQEVIDRLAARLTLSGGTESANAQESRHGERAGRVVDE